MERRLERAETLLEALGSQPLEAGLQGNTGAHDEETQSSVASQSYEGGSPIYEGPSSFTHQFSLAGENIPATEKDFHAGQPNLNHSALDPASVETNRSLPTIPGPRKTDPMVASPPLQLDVVAAILQLVQSMSHSDRRQETQDVHLT